MPVPEQGYCKKYGYNIFRCVHSDLEDYEPIGGVLMPITCPSCTHDKVCSLKNQYQVLVSSFEVQHGDKPGFSVRCDNYAEKPVYRPAQWSSGGTTLLGDQMRQF